MSREAFLSRDDRKGSPSHRRSRKQERELAKGYGGRITVASGSKTEKGDVRIRGLVRVEAKTTKHASFSVTLDMIRKIEEAALPAGEMPVLAIEFNDGRGNKVAEVAVVPMYVIAHLKGDK